MAGPVVTGHCLRLLHMHVTSADVELKKQQGFSNDVAAQVGKPLIYKEKAFMKTQVSAEAITCLEPVQQIHAANKNRSTYSLSYSSKILSIPLHRESIH